METSLGTNPVQLMTVCQRLTVSISNLEHIYTSCRSLRRQLAARRMITREGNVINAFTIDPLKHESFAPHTSSKKAKTFWCTLKFPLSFFILTLSLEEQKVRVVPFMTSQRVSTHTP